MGKKRPLPTLENTVTAIQALSMRTYHDLCLHRDILVGEGFNGVFKDQDTVKLRRIIRGRYAFDPGSANVRDAVSTVAYDNRQHPFRDWLDTIEQEWDGIERLDTMLTTYFGAPDTPYVRALSRIMLVAACRRVRKPGCEFQLFIVLEGPQGLGKSKALKVLVGIEYFSDNNILGVRDSKHQMEMMEGVVIFELAELQGLTNSPGRIESVKAFASRQVDSARMAYGHLPDRRPRACIFIGTVNDLQYLHDRTGNRRFGPVVTTIIDLAALEKDRDQLWAEAAARETRGDSIELPEELWGVAAKEQEERLQGDPWEDRIKELEADLRKNATHHLAEREIKKDRWMVATIDLLDTLLEVPKERQGTAANTHLASAMRRCGWTREDEALFFKNGRRARGYWKPAAAINKLTLEGE
jgi:predicted P-loop ATPase